MRKELFGANASARPWTLTACECGLIKDHGYDLTNDDFVISCYKIPLQVIIGWREEMS